MYQINDYELLYLIQENEDTALDIMYQKYIPLIKARISDYHIKHYNYDDFYQEGLLMLHKAITTYNPSFNKTFNKYFDLLLTRRFIRIIRRDSFYFSNVSLFENGDFILEETLEVDYETNLIFEIAQDCKFSDIEAKVFELLKDGYKAKEISEILGCEVNKVYYATDRVRLKLRLAKKALDNTGEIC